jgi:hypothetical protein
MSEDLTRKIRELLLQIPCYVLFNKDTLEPVSTSGSEYTPIPEGFSQAVIKYTDHEDLINGKKKLHNYFIKISDDGKVEFKPLEEMSLPSVYIDSSNTIRDLNPSQAFFDYLGIPFSLVDDQLIVEFSEDKLSAESVKYFDVRINNTGLKVNLCVTDYADPTRFYEIHGINLGELYSKRKIQYQLLKPYKRVSVWATTK